MTLSIRSISLLLLLSATGGGSLRIPSILESTMLADGLDIVLPEEEAAYAALDDESEQRRFRTLFWTRRDPDPATFDNPTRRQLIERALLADARYGGNQAGRDSDRGRLFTLLGQPTKLDISERYQRFHYDQIPCGGAAADIVLSDREGTGDYTFEDKESAEALLLAARECLVVSPAISYEERERGLPAPDVSGVEWQEMAAARTRYEREGRAPDFPLHAALNYVRASRERATAFLDIDLEGREIVRDRAGAGKLRHVAIAAKVTTIEGKVVANLRDLGVLASKESRAKLRIPFDIEPGSYDLTILEREPLLKLLSFRKVRFDIPDFDLPRITTSSLIVGRIVPPKATSADLPLALRLDDLLIEPRDFPEPPETPFAVFVHAYGFKGVAVATLFLDGEPVRPLSQKRNRQGDEQRLAIILPHGGEKLILMLSDPSSGAAVMLARDFAGSPVSRLASESDLAAIKKGGDGKGGDGKGGEGKGQEDEEEEDDDDDEGGPEARLLSPASGENPVVVTHAKAEVTDGKTPVAFFVDGSLTGIRLRPPYRYPIRFRPGRNRMRIGVRPLVGLQERRPSFGIGEEVTLVSRTPIFHVQTTLVPVYATVADQKRRRFVTGLRRSDFRLEDDGKPQPLTHFEPDTRDPLTVALLLDESFDMAPYLPAARTGFARFAAKLRPIDRGFVVGFDRAVSLRTDITSCKGCLVAAVLGSAYSKPPPADFRHRIVSGENPYGRLMDALEAAVFRLAAQGGRKIVLIASHGNDSGSRIGYSRVNELARRYGVMVYAVGLNIHPNVSQDELDAITTDPGFRERFVKAIGLGRLYAKKDSYRNKSREKWRSRLAVATGLDVMATASGGRAYLFDVSKGQSPDLEPAMQALWNELRHQYFLGYDAPATGPGVHEIQVTIPGKPYRVRSRSAYYGS